MSIVEKSISLDVHEARMLNGAILGQRTNIDFNPIRGEILSRLAIEKYDTIELPEMPAKPVVPPISPKGIRIENAHIDGKLDLEDCEINFPLSFHNCTFGSQGSDSPSVILTDTKLQSLVFLNCKIFGGVAARRITTRGNFRIQGSEVYGRTELIGAQIGRNLSFGQTDTGGASKFFNKGKVAIWADRIDIGSSFLIRKAEFYGKVKMPGAIIKADVNAIETVFFNGDHQDIKENVAFDAYRMSVGGDLALMRSKVSGQLNFRGVTVGGDFDANSATLSHEGGIALRASRITVGNNFCLGKSAKVTGCTRLTGAKIGGQAYFDGTTLDASVGQLWALFASGIHVKGSVYLVGGFQAISGVDFDNAKVNGKLFLRGGQFSSAPDDKPMVDVDTGDLVIYFPEVQTADYESTKIELDEQTAISLVRASIGHLVMPDKRPEGITSLARSHANIFEDFYQAWPVGETEYDHIILDGFTYDFLKNTNGEENSRANVAERRLKWLEAQPGYDLKELFKPNSWIQLKKVLKKQGRFDSAERIGIELRRHRRRTYPFFSTRRLQDKIMDFTSSYGTKPWETVFQMLLVVFMFAGLWWSVALGCKKENCFDGTVFVRSAMDAYDTDQEKNGKVFYPAFSPLAFSFDAFIPLADFKYNSAWTINTAYHPIRRYDFGEYGSITLTVGQLLYSLYFLEVLLGIVLTGLAIIGFTGYLSRDEQT